MLMSMQLDRSLFHFTTRSHDINIRVMIKINFMNLIEIRRKNYSKIYIAKFSVEFILFLDLQKNYFLIFFSHRFGNKSRPDETDAAPNVTSFPDSLSLTSYKTDARWQQSVRHFYPLRLRDVCTYTYVYNVYSFFTVYFMRTRTHTRTQVRP